jgi:hypothetical protein
MSEMGEMFNALKKERQKKRAENRVASTATLVSRGIRFESHNDGIHLMVNGPDGYVDFWPSTGKWVCRATGRKGRGVKNLIAHINRSEA